jgi:cytochrome b
MSPIISNHLHIAIGLLALITLIYVLFFGAFKCDETKINEHIKVKRKNRRELREKMTI